MGEHSRVQNKPTPAGLYEAKAQSCSCVHIINCDYQSLVSLFCFRFFSNWTDQQHYKTSLYDMGWWFGGSVGIEPFWWIILDKNNIHSFHLCMISGNQDEAWPMYHGWPISRAIYAWVIRWHVTGMLSLAEHWHSRRALSNHVFAHSVIVMWHVIFRQHLARACSEQSRSTAVLPINHMTQMLQRLSGFVNHDYWWTPMSVTSQWLLYVTTSNTVSLKKLRLGQAQSYHS